MKISLKILEKMPFCPHLKLKINLLIGTGDLWSVQNSSYLRDQMAIQVRYQFHRGINFSHHKISAMGPKFSVLCHVATGSMVSHHGLRKYWHFGFCEVSPTLCIYTKGEGG